MNRLTNHGELVVSFYAPETRDLLDAIVAQYGASDLPKPDGFDHLVATMNQQRGDFLDPQACFLRTIDSNRLQALSACVAHLLEQRRFGARDILDDARDDETVLREVKEYREAQRENDRLTAKKANLEAWAEDLKRQVAPEIAP